MRAIFSFFKPLRLALELSYDLPPPGARHPLHDFHPLTQPHLFRLGNTKILKLIMGAKMIWDAKNKMREFEKSFYPLPLFD
jgi:hypothetical protein